MMKETWLMFLVVFVISVPQWPANPIKCQEHEFLDDQGRCSPCMECGPGTELSKECGYGEGRGAHCVPCPPMRFKNKLGYHGCKPCVNCNLINRIERANCSDILDAVCGDCFPGFYRKTQIGGFRDRECIPCSKYTPYSELQCFTEDSLETEEAPTMPVQELVFVVLSICTLIVFVLVLLSMSILYCQRTWKNRSQDALPRRQDGCDQQMTVQDSGLPEAVYFVSRVPEVRLPLQEPDWDFLSRFPDIPLPFQEPDWDFLSRIPEGHLPDLDLSSLIPPGSQAPLDRCLLENQPLIRDSGCCDCSIAELGQDCGAAGSGSPVAPASSCATERVHHWPHAPVECSELDLQNLPTQPDILAAIKEENDGEAAQAESTSELELNPKPPGYPGCPAAEASLSPESLPSFQNPTTENKEQQEGNVRSLAIKADDATQAD